MHETITEQNIKSVCEKLSKKDRHMAQIFETYGAPPLWDREPTFATLIHIILEQQVSLASALSAFNKLQQRLGKIIPQKLLKLDDAELRACYFSKQKAGYARNLAEAILNGSLDLDGLSELTNEEVKSKLKQIKGIGDWTADIYLLMVMLRADIMPKGDIALHAAWEDLKGLEKRPGSDEFIKTAKRWKPYRSVAARLLWQFYLSERENRKT